MRKQKQKKRQSRGSRNEGLHVIRPNVAGIDLGSREHYVCCPSKDGLSSIRHFGTTTPELNELADWLASESVESVAMESTSVYWIPIYELLEKRGFEVLLVNARSLSSVPGRKTDVLDCEWIQRLHSYGLLKGSFRPGEAICRWRALVREKNMMEDRHADWMRRMQKSLDQMNVQVHHAVSDISGLTGMSILRAIVEGERDPQILAKLRDPRCRKSEEEIARHLTGNWREEHLFVLRQNLAMYDQISSQLDEYRAEILKVMAELQPSEASEVEVPEIENKNKRKNIRKRGQEPMRAALYRLSGVDMTELGGVGVETTEVILSELGTDLSMFPTEKHFVSYVNLSPKLAISGGKQIKGKRCGTAPSRIGNALRMAAVTLRNTDTALGAEYRRISRRKGASVAVFAMARKLAKLIYRLLRWGQAYVDEGAKAYEDRFKANRLRACHETAKQFGYKLLPMKEATT